MHKCLNASNSIIADVPDAEIVENITVNTRDIKFYRVCCQWWFYHDTLVSNDGEDFAHKPGWEPETDLPPPSCRLWWDF